VKGHSKVEENERVDKRAKKETQQEKTYFIETNLEPFQNKVDLIKKDAIISSNYRKRMKQIHQDKIIQETKKNKNKT